MNTDKILRREILSRSRSKIWHEALQEWSLIGIRKVPDGSFKCICSQHPANEACLMHNKYTLIGIEVGNTCVQKMTINEYYNFKWHMKNG